MPHLNKSPLGRGENVNPTPANQVMVINKLIILKPAPGEEVKIIWSAIIKSSLFMFHGDASLDIWSITPAQNFMENLFKPEISNPRICSAD